MAGKINVWPFFHSKTGTLTYLVVNTIEKKCLIIDPLRDYNENKLMASSVDNLLTHIKEHDLKVEWVLDTHVHADHCTAAFYLHEKLNCKTGILSKYKDLQLQNNHNHWKIDENYSAFLNDGDVIYVGSSPIFVMSTPGHTAACASYIIEDYIFSGDLFLMPDIGSGRCDFEGGNPSLMYDSAKKIFMLPGFYKICVGHDYPKPNQKFRYLSSIKEQRDTNRYLSEKEKEKFIHNRNARDSQLSPPALINLSIPYNLYKVFNAGFNEDEKNTNH